MTLAADTLVKRLARGDAHVVLDRQRTEPIGFVKTPELVGGQWRFPPEGGNEVVIVTNRGFPLISLPGQLRLLSFR